MDVAWVMGPADPHEENEEQERGLELWHLLAPAAWASVDQPNAQPRLLNWSGVPGALALRWLVRARS